jgi:uncharacterized iron-regulated membrane protein
VFTHRYLGVAVGLLMVMWFASGIVMMYVAYPERSETEKLRTLSPIAWDACCALDEQKIADDQPVRAAVLENMGTEPVLRFRPEGQRELMAALGPSGPFEIDALRARAIALAAAERLTGTSVKPLAAEAIDRDQWTVGEDYEGDRPLYRFLFDDPAGTEMYVSSATGQVVLWTTASERFWNWLGAVPHWLYFTELRANGPLWSQIMIWTSIVGGFLTVIGLTLGILQFKRGSGSRISPYRGWFYWHHIAGLFFGIVALTWVVSGTFSMNPWGFLEGGGGNERVRVAGKPVPWSEMRASLAAVKANPPAGAVKLSTALLDGKLFWLATTAEGEVERLDASGHKAPTEPQDLTAAADRIAGEKEIASQDMLAREDEYYFGAPGRRSGVTLPVYRVILNDAEHTRFYIDPTSGALMGRMDSAGRGYRWLFNGLHRIDFAPWLRARPLWDVIVLILMLGGLALTGTGAYLAILRIGRDLKPSRR